LKNVLSLLSLISLAALKRSQYFTYLYSRNKWFEKESYSFSTKELYWKFYSSNFWCYSRIWKRFLLMNFFVLAL